MIKPKTSSILGGSFAIRRRARYDNTKSARIWFLLFVFISQYMFVL
jgi:hypothetical protein